MRETELFQTALSVFLLAIAAVLPVSAHEAIQQELKDLPVSLKGCHELALYGGLRNQATTESNVSSGTMEAQTRTTAPVGSAAYAYWVTQSLSIGVSFGLIDAGTTASVQPGKVASESSAVLSLLLRTAYYPPGLTIGRVVRPYGSLAIGPYLGSATNSRVGALVENRSVSETVVGMCAQLGIDVFWNRRFKTGIVGGYHLVDKFDEQIGHSREYSGPEFSVGVGMLLGGE